VNDGGKGHTANVSGFAVSNDGGKVYSIGFDDHLREIETTAPSSGPAFMCVYVSPISEDLRT